MTEKLDPHTINAMSRAGIGFLADVPAPGGNATLYLSPGEVPEYVADPASFFARKNSVTLEQYKGWLGTDGLPRCAALTADGSTCRKNVSGGGQRSLQDWVREDGGYCTQHGGLTRAEVDAERKEGK